MLKRYAPLLTAMILLWSAVLASGQAGGAASQANGAAAGQNPASAPTSSPDQANPPQSNSPDAKPASAVPQEEQPPSTAGTAGYEGKLVQSIQIPGVGEDDRKHMLELLPQKAGEPLDRGRVRDSIRAL